MRKFVLCLGIAAFLLPVCLSSCQKEEIKPIEEKLNITKANGVFVDFVTTVNNGLTVVRITGFIELGPNGEIIGGHIYITTVPSDPYSSPEPYGSYHFSFANHQLQDPDGNEVSMEEVFPGLMDAIENYIHDLINE